MKTATHNGRLVAILQKTSHNVTRIAECFVSIIDGKPRVVVGPHELVDSREVLHSSGPPTYPGKVELTQDDRNRLSAARGLPRSVLSDAKPDRSGLLPSVSIYNLSIKLGKLIGVPIVPCVS